MSARLIQVIEADEPRGVGVTNDPCRLVGRYYTADGELLAERDRWLDEERERAMAENVALTKRNLELEQQFERIRNSFNIVVDVGLSTVRGVWDALALLERLEKRSKVARRACISIRATLQAAGDKLSPPNGCSP